MGKRERLDRLLVRLGLVESREDARGRILAGEILVDDRPITKAGTEVDENSVVRLKSKPSDYVSRGGTKLEKALREFNADVWKKLVLDVGASTGGFSDCLLAHGARRVYAVDVGYGQLDWKLRNDPRIVVFEKTNIRHLQVEQLPCLADLATIDVSFISLRIVLPHVKKLLVERGEVIALIKPQFEVGKGKVGKGGVVRSVAEHLRVIDEIKAAASELAFEIGGVTESPLLGPKGNREFFIYLKKNGEA